MNDRFSKRNLLLGSASKPRSWVLDQIGLNYDIKVSNTLENNPVPQDSTNEETAREIILKNSSLKLDSILKSLSNYEKKQFFGVICFDTIIWLPPDNYIAKPSTKDDLLKILKLLSGKSHKVLTAFSYASITREGTISKVINGVDQCIVGFKIINEYLLKKYISESISLQFAGGYNIQGSSAMFINTIEGDFYTVVGVPLSLWLKTLEEQKLDNYKELIDNIAFR